MIVDRFCFQRSMVPRGPRQLCDARKAHDPRVLRRTYLAAQGFVALHGFFAAHGLFAAHGFFAAQGYFAAHGLQVAAFAAQGLADEGLQGAQAACAAGILAAPAAMGRATAAPKSAFVIARIKVSYASSNAGVCVSMP